VPDLDDVLCIARWRTKPGKRTMSKNRVLVVVRAYEDPTCGGGVAVVYRYEDRPPISKHNETCAMSWFLEHHEPIVNTEGFCMNSTTDLVNNAPGSPNTQVLIMCQGQQRRLPLLNRPKHLLQIGGVPILQRTIHLLAEHGVPDCIVIGPQAIADDMQHWAIPTFLITLADPGICIVDGILAARDRWSGSARTLVLLGDVVWSQAALAAFLADERPVVFAGTPVLSASEGEVFALGFDDPQAMRNLCMSCPCRVDRSRIRGFPRQQGGHLRRLLWHAQEHARLRVHPSLRRSWHEDMYLPIEDWTTDIDTPKDAERLPDLARLAELEARSQTPDGCDVKPFSSRACELGTRGCETRHEHAVADTHA
jgi:molybdopterin-guanine dinucleotide biosynthesis protein A